MHISILSWFIKQTHTNSARRGSLDWNEQIDIL